MKPELKRIKIAEACGFNKSQWLELGSGIVFGMSASIPDYLNDLNAMNEAEKILGDKWDVYQCTLSNLQSGLRHDARCHWSDVGSGFVSHATAAQRAEAFLRTLNLWEE